MSQHLWVRPAAAVILCLHSAVTLAVPISAPAEADKGAAPATTKGADGPPAILATQPTGAPAFEEARKAIEGFKPASGLKVDIFAAEPQLANPVALSIDDKGRFWVVETFRFDTGGEGKGVYDIRHRYHQLDDDLASKTVEQRLETTKKWNNGDLSELTKWPDRVRLVEDRDGDGVADHSTVYADDFKDPMDGVAAGVLAVGNDVYFADIPHLWLLKDTNGDNVADVKKSLSYGYGVHYSLLGHDLHGLRMGPDGRIYFSVGDRGLHVKTNEGKVLDYPDEGTVLRCEPDGSKLEVFARGLRNPQKLVFDELGNLFTGDNNADYGELARWVYVVDGGDTGWRIGYQHIRTPRPSGPWLQEKLMDVEGKNTAAYTVPAVATIAGGPSGCTYYPGTGLPDRYNQHFFLTDYQAGPTSKTHSFALKPKGASFELVDRKFFVEKLIATDIEFGPDSAAYLTDWMQGYAKPGKGRIWRITSPEAAKSPEVAEVKKLLNEGPTNRKGDELQRLLGHRDLRVRQAAQFELAKRGNESIALLTETAEKSDKQMARVHAIWGLWQIGRKNPEALKAIVPLMADTDAEVRAQAAKIAGDVGMKEAYEPLVKLLADESPRVQFFAAIAVGKLKRAEAVPALVKMLAAADNKDAYLRHAGVMGLVGSADAGVLVGMAKDPSPAVRMGGVLALRRLGGREIAVYLNDADPAVVAEAARAINDVPIEGAYADLAKLAKDVKLPEVVLHRALNANLRLGTAENASVVAAVASSKDAQVEMRVEAIRMLADWTKPRGMDRVVGIWRAYGERDAGIAAGAGRSILKDLVTTGPDPVRVAAIELLKKIGTDQPGLLLATVSDPTTPPSVSAAALGAMEETKDGMLEQAVDVALRQGKGELRAKAIVMSGSRQDAVPRLEGLLSTGSVADQQAVFDALAKLDQPAAQQILEKWMDKLIAGQVAPELQLDLLDAARAKKAQSLRAKLKEFNGKRSKEDSIGEYRESLVGGDAAEGKKVFFERAEVSCVRCHKVEGTGGIAGPDLTGVGVRRDRNYLLESLVDPNKQIAEGFESVTVQMKAGKKYTGVVKSENADEMVLDAGDGAIIHVAKKEVDSRSKGLSPMPQDIAKPLSKRDLRNLVEFLASQKQQVKPVAQGQ